MIIPVLFFLILAISIGVSIWARVGHTTSNIGEFLIGGRSFPPWLVYFLAVGEIYSIGTMIGLPAGIYAKGASYGLWFLGYILLAYPVGYFLAPLVWRAGKKYGAMTLPDVFGRHFNSRTLELVTCLVMFAGLIPWGQYQFIGLQVVLTNLGMHMSKLGAVVLAAIIAFIYVAVSGIRSPAFVAILKDGLMLTAILVIGVFALNDGGGIGNVFHPSGVSHGLVTMTGGPTMIFALTTIAIQAVTFYLGLSSAYIFPARSERAVKSSTVWMPLYMLIYPFLIFATYYGVSHAKGVKDPNTIFMVIAKDLLPDWLIGIVAAAAGLSGVLVLAVTALSLGGVVTRNVVPNIAESKQRRITTVVIGIFLIAAAGITMTGSTLMLTVLTLMYVFFAQVIPAWLGIMFFKGLRPIPICVGMLTGIGMGILFYVTKWGLGGFNSGLVALGANVIVTVVGSKLAKGPSPDPLRLLSAAEVHAAAEVHQSGPQITTPPTEGAATR